MISTLRQIAISRNQQSVIYKIVAMLLRKYNADYPGSAWMPRLLHNKSHGLPSGTLEIGEDVPLALKKGIFRKAGSYPVYLRFSNGSGSNAPDSRPDVRGLAIKVRDVSQENREITQDFVMGNYPTFFVRNAADMAEFIENIKAPQNFFFGWNPFNWRLKELSNLLRCVTRGVRNPLAEQYWSQTPYKLGDLEVKLSVKPRLAKSEYVSMDEGPDFLRKNMAAHLSAQDADFDLLVQVRDWPHLEPLNDATVEWKSPFHKVGTIKLPQQTFDTEQLDIFAENLRFSPWNTLPEHLPLGDLNVVREAVYRLMSGERLERNGVPVA